MPYFDFLFFVINTFQPLIRIIQIHVGLSYTEFNLRLKLGIYSTMFPLSHQTLAEAGELV